eukprot:GFUD01026886.1.p1 GENE.GFUD01026886.1~~GFUD01026886.1.p1  ORF type:complete len:351 (-),score=94.42 GFUD01026886.1:165-1217(-)
MDEGVQCNLLSGQRSLLVRLEDRIIENQINLFAKTEKLFKSQNEKIVKLTKLVDAQSETIGTLDARLEIIYRFLNKEIKDMEGRVLASLDTISASFTNQLVYSFPYALSPLMAAMANIQKKVDFIYCSDADNSNLASSEHDIACSDARDPVIGDLGPDVGTVRELSEIVLPDYEYMEGSDDLCVLKSEVSDEIMEVNSNLVAKQYAMKEVSSNNNNDSGSSSQGSSGLKFILKSLGLPGKVPASDIPVEDIKTLVEDKASDASKDHKEIVKTKRKSVEDDDDSVKNIEFDQIEAQNIAKEDLEEGEILEDDQEVTIVPIGRITVKTSGIFKEETRPIKKRKRSCKRKRLL